MNVWGFGGGTNLRNRVCLFLVVGAVAGLMASSAFTQDREKPENILLFGLKAYQDGFYDPAADALARYLNVQPGGPRAANARYFLAKALRHAEKYKEAISVHREFLTRHSKDKRAPKIRFQLAEMFQKIGDNSSAARVYASLPKGPFRAESVYRMAQIRLKAREWMGAAVAMKEFVDLLPDDPRVEAVEFERARTIDQLKRYEEAEALYQSNIGRYPKSARSRTARLRLGFIQFHLKKYARAETTFRDVMDKNPKDAGRPEFRLALAASLYGQKKYQKAAVTFEETLALLLSARQRQKAMRGAADSWWAKKEYQRAAKVYRRIVSAKMGTSRLLGRFLRGVKYSGGCGWSGREALRFANEAAKRGAELTPGDQLMFAGCLQSAGMKVEAMEHYGIVAQSSGRLPVGIAADLQIAEILEKSGHLKDAAAKYEKLLSRIVSLKDDEKKAHPELLSGSYRGVLRAAGIHFREGKCKPAVRLAKLVPRARVPVKNRAEVASLRAECAYQLGSYEEAEIYFRRVLIGARRPELASSARLRLAAIAEARGDKEVALRGLMEALPLLPAKMQREVRLNAGRLYREMGKIKESRVVLLPYAKDEKGNAKRRREIWLLLAHDAASAGEWTKASEALENWNDLSPSDRREGQILWVQVLFQLSKCPLAVEMAEKALAGEIDNSRRLGLLRISASCLLKDNKFTDASAFFKEILVLNPDDAEVAYQMGVVFEQTEELGRAADAYGSFVDRFPGHPLVTEAAFRLGSLRDAEGNRQAALKAYRLAVRSPRQQIFESARYQISLDLEDRGKLKEALASFERLASGELSKSKWRRAAGWHAAALLERRGEWNRALSYYSRISKIIPADGAEDDPRVREGRRATARVNQIEAYLKEIEERKEKVKRQVPLFR